MFGVADEGPKSTLSLEVSDICGLLSCIRPEIEETSDEYRAAVLLLAGPSLSFNIDRLARRTRFPRQFVAMCTRRLFDNGVWLADGPVYTWQHPSDERFWRDVDVAVGRAYRRSIADGCVEWGMITSWRKKYDFGQDPDASIATVYLTNPELPVPLAEAEIEEPIMLQLSRDDGFAVRELTVIPKSAPEPEIELEPVLVTAIVADPPSALTTPLAAAALHDSMMELFPGTQWL